MRFSIRSLAVSACALTAALAATSASALVIQPVFDQSITSDPNAATIENGIYSVIAFYQSLFTDNVTVKIYFQEGGGLGGSLRGYYYNSAGLAINALTADASTADDAVAVSHLNTNVFGSVAYSTANGRALGLNTPGLISVNGVNDYDGIITLNTSVCFYNHYSPEGGKFDFFSVCSHELDEILGTWSGASDWLAYTADLFRYDGSGNRSFSGDANAHAYFSIDGMNDIVEYNQYGHTQGDWGDWVSHIPSQTQDWLIYSGQSITPGEPELRLLDVVGYDRVTRADSYSIYRGAYQSGSTYSLMAVDANPLVVRAGVTPIASDYPVQVIVVGTSPTHNPSSLQLRLSSKVQLSHIGQTVEFYDFSAGAYVPVDFRIGTQGYASIEVTTTSPARFVDPATGHVQARIKFKGTQALPILGWNVWLDQVAWNIKP
ncbi:MAG TPA: NF038122 family metalloprotease [Fimbriimonadaceae bacterium]|nr:NF038122 family metalloprotease [Fimbriimonadaceae bacterium]